MPSPSNERRTRCRWYPKIMRNALHWLTTLCRYPEPESTDTQTGKLIPDQKEEWIHFSYPEMYSMIHGKDEFHVRYRMEISKNWTADLYDPRYG